MQINNKNNSFFNIISNSLKFEDDNSQQNDKEDQANASADEKLDAQLDDLKENKDQGDQNDLDTDSSDNNDSDNEESDFDDLGFGGEEDSSGISSDDSSESSSSGSGSLGSDEEQKNVGSVARPVALYTEFNRIYNVLKETVDAFDKMATENDNIKTCRSALSELIANVKFILSNFDQRSEEDIMLQMQITKKRASLILQLMERQNQKPL
ncbi:MAG: hypothetical protein J5614_04250 [Paludibacteraceae bacterium]|nr:hypothetical protein [Paludibacteraceae bacterium]